MQTVTHTHKLVIHTQRESGVMTTGAISKADFPKKSPLKTQQQETQFLHSNMYNIC